MKPRFVLDSSVTLSWQFEDEISPYSESILDYIENTAAAVPAIWPLEVANVLAIAERTKRITTNKISSFLAGLCLLPITVDVSSAPHIFDDVLSLARQHRLTAYDASYLDLARRLRLPLATLDAGLKRAAKAASVELLKVS